MCIRDRVNGLGYEKFLWRLGTLPFYSSLGCGSRSLILRIVFFGGMVKCIWAACQVNMCVIYICVYIDMCVLCVFTVSYTHLDVYKRQELKFTFIQIHYHYTRMFYKRLEKKP